MTKKPPPSHPQEHHRQHHHHYHLPDGLQQLRDVALVAQQLYAAAVAGVVHHGTPPQLHHQRAAAPPAAGRVQGQHMAPPGQAGRQGAPAGGGERGKLSLAAHPCMVCCSKQMAGAHVRAAHGIVCVWCGGREQGAGASSAGAQDNRSRCPIAGWQGRAWARLTAAEACHGGQDTPQRRLRLTWSPSASCVRARCGFRAAARRQQRAQPGRRDPRGGRPRPLPPQRAAPLCQAAERGHVAALPLGPRLRPRAAAGPQHSLPRP